MLIKELIPQSEINRLKFEVGKIAQRQILVKERAVENNMKMLECEANRAILACNMVEYKIDEWLNRKIESEV